jgi:hypothetical protein
MSVKVELIKMWIEEILDSLFYNSNILMESLSETMRSEIGISGLRVEI